MDDTYIKYSIIIINITVTNNIIDVVIIIIITIIYIYIYIYIGLRGVLKAHYQALLYEYEKLHFENDVTDPATLITTINVNPNTSDTVVST